MRRHSLRYLAFLVLAVLVATLAWRHRDGGCRECADARLVNAWCEACDVGWVAGFPIRSKVLFEGLDAHGHEVDPDAMHCETCKRLRIEGGFCETCGFGWVDGLAYMSRLTYCLGQGEPRDPGSLSCGTCRDLTRDAGWCEACDVGWVGNVRFVDRDRETAAASELVRLRAAVEASPRCEMCAMVILSDGRCPRCKIAYAAGRPVQED